MTQRYLTGIPTVALSDQESSSQSIHHLPLQSYMLGLHRSDYMYHEPAVPSTSSSSSSSSLSNSAESTGKLLQIELNTISSSFGSLSSRISEYHTWLYSRILEDPSLPYTRKYFFSPPSSSSSSSSSFSVPTVATKLTKSSIGNGSCTLSSLPSLPSASSATISHSRSSLARGLALGHSTYCLSRNNRNIINDGPIVLFVVQPGERNIQDQRQLEYELFNHYGIRSRRATLTQIALYGKLSSSSASSVLPSLSTDRTLSCNELHTILHQYQGNVSSIKPLINTLQSHSLYLPVYLPSHQQETATTGHWFGLRDKEIFTEKYLASIPYEEISVVYYRSGYSPDDYPSELEWEARLFMEYSNSIKCPSLPYHLAGTKKIQQVVAQPQVLEYFLSKSMSVNDIQLLRSSFAGLWSLDYHDQTNTDNTVDPNDASNSQSTAFSSASITSFTASQAIAHARIHPEYYVLKPQREGGGNNIYNHDIAIALGGGNSSSYSSSSKQTVLTKEELNGYILMERIFPSTAQSILVKQGQYTMVPSVLSELGVYGVYLGNGSTSDTTIVTLPGRRRIDVSTSSSSTTPKDDYDDDDNEERKSTPQIFTLPYNTPAGHLLRTKASGVDEGGVAAGFAVLDSPLLV